MQTKLPGWNTGKKLHKCNRFPTVWAAIIGCKGERVPFWRYTVGNFGHRVPEYACLCCQEFDAKTNGPDHQEVLRAAQDAAGVNDYRTASFKIVNGVPTLLRDERGNVIHGRNWE